MANAYRVGRMVAGAPIPAATVQLVAPEENSTGVVIRTGHIWLTGGAANGTAALIAEKTAPASYAASIRTVFSMSASSGVRLSAPIPYPIYIDPGFGVYLVTSTAVTEGYGLITFDFVDGLENA